VNDAKAIRARASTGYRAVFVNVRLSGGGADQTDKDTNPVGSWLEGGRPRRKSAPAGADPLQAVRHQTWESSLVLVLFYSPAEDGIYQAGQGEFKEKVKNSVV
jgi:hypothetical protein